MKKSGSSNPVGESKSEPRAGKRTRISAPRPVPGEQVWIGRWQKLLRKDQVFATRNKHRSTSCREKQILGWTQNPKLDGRTEQQSKLNDEQQDKPQEGWPTCLSRKRQIHAGCADRQRRQRLHGDRTKTEAWRRGNPTNAKRKSRGTMKIHCTRTKSKPVAAATERGRKSRCRKTKIAALAVTRFCCALGAPWQQKREGKTMAPSDVAKENENTVATQRIRDRRLD
jgi:hypothetical protein